MKKNVECLHWLAQWRKKMLRVMKVVLFLMVLGLTSVYATTFSQQKVTFEVKNQTLLYVLDLLQEQSEYTFLFSSEDIKEVKGISLSVDNMDVFEVLEKCLTGTGITFEINDRLVVLKRGEKQVLSMQTQVQKVRVKGVVHDKQKLPLPGVTVKVQGISLGTTTNVDGRFALDLPMMKGTLEFSSIGYKKHRENFTSESDTLRIVLEEDVMELEDVVCLGYYDVDKRKSTSAITTLKMDDIMQPGISTLDQMLEGQVPGMMFMQNSGQVGVTPKLKIRGTTTLLGSTAPLWVLDGMILSDPVNVDASKINDLDFVNLLGNAISGLNPNDIDQIDVLKDASATAIYGPQASNGVIVITTKRGKVGKPSVTYSLNGTFRQRPRYTDRAVNVMNSMERIAYSREAINAGWRIPSLNAWVGYEAAYADYLNNEIDYEEFVRQVSDMETANTDWLGLLLQDTYSHNHSLNVSGGTDNLRYYASLGYMDEKGNTRGEDNKRYTAMVNLNLNFNKWDFRFSLNGNSQEKKYTPEEVGVANYAYTTSRSVPAYTKEGKLLYYDMDPKSMFLSDFNIINEMKNSWQHINTDQIGLQINIGYRIIPPLKFDVNFAYNIAHTDDDTWYGEDSHYMQVKKALLRKDYSVYNWEIDDYVVYKAGEKYPGDAVALNGGELSFNNTKNKSYNLRGTLTFNKMLTEEQNLTATLIGEVNQSKYSGFKMMKRNYLPDRGMIFDSWEPDEWPAFTKWAASSEAQGSMDDQLTRKIGAILSVSWAWKNTYILNGNMRMDWSNKFGDRSNEKFLPIWSLSGRWNIHENLLNGVSWVNTAALKLSFGYQGNMSQTESPRLIIEKLGENKFFGEYQSQIKNFPNPTLSWEKTATFNGSVEFALFRNKLVGNFGYFYRHTSNAFMAKKVSLFNGTPGGNYTVNAGTLINQGFEFYFQFTPINNMINAASSALSASGGRRGFRWRFDPNFGSVFNQLLDKIKPKDKILQDEIKIEDYLNGKVQVAGRPVNTFYSYRFKGLNHNTGAPEFYGTERYYQATDVQGNPMYDENGQPVMKDRVDEYVNMKKEDIWMSQILAHSGCREPFLQGGISNTFEYNNWVLSFNLAYSIGSKIRLFRMYDNGGSLPQPQTNLRRDWEKRWRVPGDEAHTNIPGIVGGQAYKDMQSPWWVSGRATAFSWASNMWDMYDYSDIRVVSGNYLKLSSLQLRYLVPDRICRMMYMQSAYISVSGTNLFTLCSKKLKGQDPSQSGSTQLINISVRPTYTLTLNVTF